MIREQLGVGSEAVCQLLHLQPGMCDQGTWNSGPYASYPLSWFLYDLVTFIDPDDIGSIYGVASQGLDYADKINKIHVNHPLSMALDFGTQIYRDFDDDYSLPRRAARATLVMFEGQFVASAAAWMTGIEGIAAAGLGPGDAVIMGGGYLMLNVAGSAAADKWNHDTAFPWIEQNIP